MGEFKKRQGVFLLQLIGVTAVLFAVHSYLLYHFAKDIIFFFSCLADLRLPCINYIDTLFRNKL
jgi:hypothetical protein